MATPATTVQITDAPDGRLGHRRHGARVAQAGRRPRRGRRAPGRDLDRQGRCRVPARRRARSSGSSSRPTRPFGGRRARRDRGRRRAPPNRRRRRRLRRRRGAAARRPSPRAGRTWPSPRWATRWPRARCSSGASRSASRWPSTTPSSRSRPTRSTPRCPRPWPARRRDPRRGRRDGARGHVLCRIAAGAGAGGPGPVAPAAGPPPTPRPPSGTAATPRRSRRGWRARTVSTSTRSQGGGPRGRVTKDDVLAAVEGNGSAPAPPRPRRPPAEDPIRGPRGDAREFMNESRSIPTATSFRTLPVDVLDSRRRELKAAGRLSFAHLIAWAIVQAARDLPVMGHGYAEQDGKPQRVVPDGLSLGHRGRRRATRRNALISWCPCSRARRSSTSPTSPPATTSSWPARATTRSRPTPTRARTSR